MPAAVKSSSQEEKRVLISEVLVKNKDGEELERKDLEAEALNALKASRANSALTVREVQDDVHRIIASGYFASCMLVAHDTRDGIRLVFQVYSMLQGKRDVDTLLTMRIMEDVSIDLQPAADTTKVDLTFNVVERKSRGVIPADSGILSGITSGRLAGLKGSCTIYHKNLFGKNQKLNLYLERGQIDSIFRIKYTDPWIEGDYKRTSRSIMIQNSRTPGTLVHGNQPDNGSLTVGRWIAGIEYGRPFSPKWNGTAGLIFQRAGAWDDKGNLLIRDFYGSPLTFAFNMDQGIPLFPEWLFFNKINARARKGIMVGPACLRLSLSGGHFMGNFPPHEAFAIGGTNSVRGYEEGAVGSGRSYAVGCGEVSFPLTGQVEGVVFADYGTDLGSGPKVPGDPAGARLKPGSGYGYGVGIRVNSPLGPLRLEYGFNDQRAGRFHFCVGLQN